MLMMLWQVHERRATTTNYMSQFISIEDLQLQVMDKLRVDPEFAGRKWRAPSLTWLMYQFQPRNSSLASSLMYSGMCVHTMLCEQPVSFAPSVAAAVDNRVRCYVRSKIIMLTRYMYSGLMS
jgi:hypothetical protein